MSLLALGYVVNLLSRREYSEYEIRCKMQEKAFTEDEIEQTILHCRQKNWQNDRRPPVTPGGSEETGPTNVPEVSNPTEDVRSGCLLSACWVGGLPRGKHNG